MKFLEKRQRQAEFIASRFEKFLNVWHSYEQPFDQDLDAWLHSSYADILQKKKYFDFQSQPHFSPSSADACERELYMKLKRAEKDHGEVSPHQRRWQALGSGIGEVVQREILLAERHFKKFTGNEPEFRMARTEEGYPFFEEFAEKMKIFDHQGQRFSIYGKCDGILLWKSPEGEIIRVGLEIKSKQSSYASTSLFSLREPQQSHIKQVTTYSLLYNIDFFIILYVNAAKKAWVMSEEDMEKYPDIRAFGVYVTEDMRQEVLNKFARVVRAVYLDSPPPLDLLKFMFNNYKKACAESLTEEELKQLGEFVRNVIKSKTIPKWKKESVFQAFHALKELRNRA